MIEIRLLSAQSEELCRAQHEKEARLCVLRAYEEEAARSAAVAEIEAIESGEFSGQY